MCQFFFQAEFMKASSPDKDKGSELMARKDVINNLYVNYLEINWPLSLQSETKVNVNHFILYLFIQLVFCEA